jgi:hypothetical protein
MEINLEIVLRPAHLSTCTSWRPGAKREPPAGEAGGQWKFVEGDFGVMMTGGKAQETRRPEDFRRPFAWVSFPNAVGSFFSKCKGHAKEVGNSGQKSQVIGI